MNAGSESHVLVGLPFEVQLLGPRIRARLYPYGDHGGSETAGTDAGGIAQHSLDDI